MTIPPFVWPPPYDPDEANEPDTDCCGHCEGPCPHKETR